MPDPSKCPKYLPADNPARLERDVTIAMMSANGTPQRQIAAKTNLTPATVCRILSDDQAKDIIQRIHDMHLSAATDIQGNIIRIAQTKPGDNDKIKTSDILQAAKEHNQIIGIAASHTPNNVFIGKYYQQNNTLSASAETLGIVSGIAKAIGALAQVPQEEDGE